MKDLHLPRPTKACCCIPLRRGIILFTYINLVVSGFSHLAFLTFDFFKIIPSLFMGPAHTVHRMLLSRHTLVLSSLLYEAGAIVELIMAVVNLVGLHRKRVRIIRAYLYYTSVFLIVVIVTRSMNFHTMIWEYDLTILFIYAGFKFYYIVMLRSQVKKMEAKEEEDALQVELGNVTEKEILQNEDVVNS